MFLVSGILIIITATVFGIYWYRTRFSYWKSRNVPYKKPFLFFGSILDLVLRNDSNCPYIVKLYNEFEGPYFGIFAMDKPFLVIRDPEFIKRIMVTDFPFFPNRIIYNNEKIDPIVSNALFTLKVPTWKDLREKITPVFSTGKIKMTTPLITECAENMVKYLNSKANESMETKDLVARFTIDSISSFAFGISVNSFANEHEEFIVAARKLFNPNFSRAIQPLCFIFAHSLVKLLKLQFFDSDSVKFLRNVSNETIKQRKISGVKRNDLIDIIIEMENSKTHDNGYKFYGDRLLAQAIMFFFAGHETAASTITFTLFELALNQDIQERLRCEIKATIQLHGGITYESTQSMKYLHMVVSETLRKYPLTSFLQRECVKDYLIPETGLVIESGCSILIPQQGLHWDPQYFPEPQKYDPERFSDQNKVNINPYCYLPFGDGPRNCIGERFGLLNVKLGVLSIIKNFVVEPNMATTIPLAFCKAFVLQAVGGVPLTYTPIEK